MYTNIYMLQLFAEAGDNINARASMVNAYTGATTARPGTQTMDPELKEFYDTELLENAREDMFYQQFSKKQSLPAGNGTTVEWRKWDTFAKADKLQEGVIPSAQPFGSTNLKGEISQFGTYTAVTDTLELHAYDDIILGATEEMGYSAALSGETLTRDLLMANTNLLFCDDADGSAATPTSIAGVTDPKFRLTPTMVNKAATTLKKAHAPKINGKYVAIIHPSVAFALRESDEWLDVKKYAAPDDIFTGEIGELHGVRFIEDTYAPIQETASSSGKMCYHTLFLAKDAFGTIDPEGGALEMIVHDKAEIGGPLNQFSTIGYKMEWGGCILYPERCLDVISSSPYYQTDEPNYTNEYGVVPHK